MTIYVSNLDPNVIDSDLRKLFAPFGEVLSAEVKRDKYNGRSRCAALVEMPVAKNGRQAICCLDNITLLGKKIQVTELHDHLKLMNF